MHLTPDIIALLALVAFVAGFIDALAGGGGLLTLPALLAAGIPPVAAIATNKLQSTFGTGGAFLAFARKGHIDFRRFALPGLAALIGSAGGAFTLTMVDPTFLKAFIPLLLIAMAIYFVAAPKMSDVDRHARLGQAGLCAAIAVIGFYDGFFGPGTGSFFTTLLVAAGGLGLVRAIAHTKFLNFTTNVAAVMLMIAGGHVIWLLGGAMAVASVAGNQAGALAAMRFGGKGVRPLLVVMSLALTVKLLSDPANPLRTMVFG
ncbi:TSUP family transporter [Sphingomonas naphthae]|uniref:Probable membrane transporter protein n=1 Tax=Sphingomonas naphthae TaxID=1813468 RepID=A0ABY7TKB4_9SPHN|nr:TSUP family transporter [Sphingomonas naphthae]WCT73401.1 TSUP family transporter [Sphingomonas naphthae]